MEVSVGATLAVVAKGACAGDDAADEKGCDEKEEEEARGERDGGPFPAIKSDGDDERRREGGECQSVEWEERSCQDRVARVVADEQRRASEGGGGEGCGCGKDGVQTERGGGEGDSILVGPIERREGDLCVKQVPEGSLAPGKDESERRGGEGGGRVEGESGEEGLGRAWGEGESEGPCCELAGRGRGP